MKHAYLGLTAALPLFAACHEGGFRAQTGHCPPGEICSGATPYGLLFEGTRLDDRFFETAVHPTAVGGTQRITVHVADEWGFADSFSRPFEATTELGDFEIVATSPPDVDVGAKASGADYLRIVSPATGELYDKLSVASRPVAAVRFAPKGDRVDADAPWAFMVQGEGELPRELRVELVAEDGERLIDTSMVASIDGAVVGDRDVWDVVTLEGLEPGRIEVSTTIGDGTTTTTEIVFVDAIDVIAPASEAPDFVLVDDQVVVCMRAEASGVAVAGVDWRFSSRGPVDLYHDELGLLLARNCVAVSGTAAGVGVVVVEADGLSLETTLDVRPAARASARPSASRFSSPTPGERALTTWAAR